MKFGKGHHLHLIDGSAFIFRAYHALPPLTRASDKLPVGAVSGFCNMLYRYVEENTGDDAPTHLAVIFDKGSHTFRNDLYDQYKANREEMPQDLKPQIPLTRRATQAFNIACKEMENYEADDIIATLASQAREAGGRVTILSSDKDLMQLVGGGVEMLDAMKNRRIDTEGVFEKFGVGPERVIDVQALAGDSVDNVPGAPGIGVKTAALLINEYGSLEELLDRAEEIKQAKRRQTLIEYRAQIELSKRLVQLDCQVPLAFTLDDLEVRPPQSDVLLGFLSEMEFRTLTRRIAGRFGVEVPAIPEATAPAEATTTDIPPISAEKYETVQEWGQLDAWLARIAERGYVAVDLETTSLNEMRAEIVGVSLATEPGEACYIPLAHLKGEDDLFGKSVLEDGQLDRQEVLARLKPVLEDPSILKIGQNIKYDLKVFARYDISLISLEDTMLLSYALNGGLHPHAMDRLSQIYLSHTPISIKSLLGTGKSAKTFDQVPIPEASRYAAEDADVTLRLWHLFRPKLHHSSVTRVYETLERPLVPVLAHMERAGIAVDREILTRMSSLFAQ